MISRKIARTCAGSSGPPFCRARHERRRRGSTVRLPVLQRAATPARAAHAAGRSPRARNAAASASTRSRSLSGWRHRIPGSARNQVRWRDRKSTRLNSSHVRISYAVFCLKKKKNKKKTLKLKKKKKKKKK